MSDRSKILDPRGNPVSRKEPTLKRLERLFAKWWRRIGTFAAVVALLAGLVTNSEKILSILPGSKENPDLQTYLLTGFIVDGQNNAPLDSVIVRLMDVRGVPTDTTDSLGRFSFEVQADTIRNVKLLAQKEGFQPYNADPMLGNPKLEFKMRRQP